MKKYIAVFLLAILVSTCTWAGTTGQCLRAVDGDTLRVELDGREVAVRLLGVDAPEKRQEWGQDAAAFARAWCAQAGEIVLEMSPKPDKYHRVLAWVSTRGEMLNSALVRAGLAVPFMLSKDHAQEIEAAQAEAQAAYVGFWSQGGLSETPAQWRRGRKK